jgi:hypothetical protein
MLALEDLEGQDEASVRDHIVCAFEVSQRKVARFEILIAYQSVGNWGCDSSCWYLLRKDGVLYENHGGHCSCYGFEGQWAPEETAVDYLLSEKFNFCTGGYDDNEDHNEGAVGREIRRIFTGTEDTGRRAAITAQKARAKNPYIATEE